MISYGRQIRDDILPQYPILPGAMYIWQQMASGREWTVSGKPRSVARAIESLNNTQTLLYDGTVDYGLEQFERRRSYDYNCIGRTMFTWGEGQPIRYLDPAVMTYYMEDKEWEDGYTNERFDVKHVVVNHPIPIGGGGNFVSPISYIIPTAMLAWLIREHDRASADGRKIRDIMVVAGQALAEQIEEAVKKTLELWAGGDVEKNGIPVIYVDPTDLGPGVKVADMITRIGLANIPEGFNREQFQFQYVNEIANALGLALRYVWNSEKATNRALEEVQEARQSQKGPAAFVRTEQRLISNCGFLNQFGADTRFGYVEEVDIASQEINAKVLKLYAEALQIFVTNLGTVVETEALVAWLQREEILPADLNIISQSNRTNPESKPTPIDGAIKANSDGAPPSSKQKSLEDGEITMNSKGMVIERRNNIFTLQRAVSEELETEYAASPTVDDKSPTIISFMEALKSARKGNVEKFKALSTDGLLTDDDSRSILKRIDELKDEDHRRIKSILDKNSEKALTG